MSQTFAKKTGLRTSKKLVLSKKSVFELEKRSKFCLEREKVVKRLTKKGRSFLNKRPVVGLSLYGPKLDISLERNRNPNRKKPEFQSEYRFCPQCGTLGNCGC